MTVILNYYASQQQFPGIAMSDIIGILT
jgi:hypothetical protein